MKAWRLSEAGNVRLEETDSQPLGENCVKVKLSYCSVAVTDRLLALGKLKAELPLILGRGAVGMVVETGENVKNVVRGDMVAIKPLTVCSSCSKCEGGKYAECENALIFGVNEDGLLRDFAILPSLDVLKLPERVALKDATFLEGIAMAVETITRLDMEKGEYLVISGATQLGIILAQVAIYYQIVPIIADIDQSFLNIAAELGVYYTINSSEEDAKKKIFALTGGRMADAAAYITCSRYPLLQTFDFVKKGGGVAVCGLEKSALDLNCSLSAIHGRRLSVYGITESNASIQSAINMLVNKTVDVSALVSQEIPFENAGAELIKEITPELIYLKTLVKI